MQPSNLAQDSATLVQSIGQTMNMAALYGVSHKVTAASLESSYPVLVAFLAAYGNLDINVVENGVLINGTPTDAPLATTLANRLTARTLLSFEINPGFSLEEYVALFQLLLMPAAQLQGSVVDYLRVDNGFLHIQPRAVGYRRVVEGEAAEPAGADTAGSGTGGTAGQPSGDGAGSEESAVPAGPDLENVVAFLRDDASADVRRSSEDIRALAGDAEKLAELILRTVEVRAAAANLQAGESLNDIVVGTIGKIISELTPPTAVRTEKGRKQAKKSLMLLENAVLTKLQKFAGDPAATAAANLIQDSAEALDLEAMAAKFIKNRKATEESAGKLRRAIDKASSDPAQLKELHDDLTSQGLSEEGWQELSFRPQAKPEAGPGTGATGVTEIKTLTLLLAKLGDAIEQERQTEEKTSSPALQEAVDEARRHMDAVAAQTERKINTLRRMLNQETDDASSPPPTLSRKELMIFLAEIGQELSQPLTVVTASIDMLLAEKGGTLTGMQNDLLAMAADSSRRLAHLVDCIIRIGGNPDSLKPDLAILTALASPAHHG